MVEFIIETAGKCCSELSASSQLLEVRGVFDCHARRFWATKNSGWEKKGLFFLFIITFAYCNTSAHLGTAG